MTDDVNAGQQKNREIKVKVVGDPADVEEFYVDGILGVAGRGGVVKLDCYRVVGIDNESKAEIRKVVRRLVLPVSAINELANVVKGVAEGARRATEGHLKGDLD